MIIILTILFLILAHIILNSWLEGESLSKNSRIAIAVILLLVPVGVYFLYKEKTDSEAKQKDKDLSVAKMVSKYDAVTNWADFERKDEPYVVDIQDVLIRQDKRPVLLNVYVIDILSTENKYLIHFKPPLVDEPEIRFILECDSEQVKRITENRDKESEYAVIALISSVQRENKTNDSEDEGQFLANGQCLDLLPLDY